MDIYLTSLPSQILTLLFLALFLVFSLKKPKRAALFFPIILPFYLVKLYITTVPFWLSFSNQGLRVIPTNLLEITIIIFILANFRLLGKGFAQLWKNNLGRFLLFSILLLLLSSFLSAFLGVNVRVGLGVAKSWFFIPILLFLAFLPLLKKESFRQKFLYSISLSGIAVALMSLPFVLAGLYTYDGRLSGIFLSPNHLAMALVPGLLALTIVILNQNPLWTPVFTGVTRRRLKILLLSLMLSAEIFLLYLTYSYGTWLGLIVASMFILTNPKYFKSTNIPLAPFSSSGKLRSIGAPIWESGKSLKLGMLVFITFIFLLISQLHNPKLAHILNSDYYSSLHSRIMIWQSALAISKDHWLFGIGGGNFQQAYLDYAGHFKEPYIEWAVPMPHNIFLAFSTQLGILGLIAFIFILILSCLHFAFTSPLSPPLKGGDDSSPPYKGGETEGVYFKKLHLALYTLQKADPLTLWSIAYLIYFLVHGLVDTPYWKNDLAIIFWLTLAMIWTMQNEQLPKNNTRTKQK